MNIPHTSSILINTHQNVFKVYSAAPNTPLFWSTCSCLSLECTTLCFAFLNKFLLQLTLCLSWMLSCERKQLKRNHNTVSFILVWFYSYSELSFSEHSQDCTAILVICCFYCSKMFSFPLVLLLIWYQCNSLGFLMVRDNRCTFTHLFIFMCWCFWI